MVVGTDIVRLLKNRKFVFTEDVLIRFIEKDVRRTPDLFFNALTFLYAFGFIEKRGYKIRLTPQFTENAVNIHN